MSDQIHIYYPRGYRVLRHGLMPVENETDHNVASSEGHSVVYSKGDSEVNELYRRYRASEDTAPWAYVAEVLSCAARLIPHANSFFFFQAHNARLHGQAFSFLEEVMCYIECGHCTLQPMSAYELIEDHPERNSGATNNRKVKSLKTPPAHMSPLATWVSHPGGLTHLIETLYVLFGAARQEKVARLPIRTLSERKLTKGWMTVAE